MDSLRVKILNQLKSTQIKFFNCLKTRCKNMVVDWHYVQLKEVDRIALHQDSKIRVEPTILTIVEKVFSSGFTTKEV